jgi:hypothetical protein
VLLRVPVGMADPTPARRRALLLVVIGIIVVVLGTFLLIGVLLGDDTDEIDPQNNDGTNGQVITPFLG